MSTEWNKQLEEAIQNYWYFARDDFGMQDKWLTTDEVIQRITALKDAEVEREVATSITTGDKPGSSALEIVLTPAQLKQLAKLIAKELKK